MKNQSFSKKCNVGKLHAELETANFNIYGVSYDGSKTTIHMKNTELKNPTSVVNSHTYTAPITKKALDWDKLVAKLISSSVISKREDIEV